jgi:hypothetical protein
MKVNAESLVQFEGFCLVYKLEEIFKAIWKARHLSEVEYFVLGLPNIRWLCNSATSYISYELLSKV